MSNDTKLKFEGLFPIGSTIRNYDYDPNLVEGRKVFAEGEITDIVEFPFKAYKILCEVCTGYGRVGKTILVPMEISSHEFDGRIELID